MFLFLQMYLDNFGYMNSTATNPANGALLSQEAVSQAIIDFQVSIVEELND